MAYTVRQYNSADLDIWNDFIEKSKNGTFLFHRDFMEYHSDRFEDFSLLVFDSNKLVAVLPANKAGEEVHSHQGLTYGGLVYDSKVKLAAVVEIFSAILGFLKDDSVNKLHIKLIPSIYHIYPSDEIAYALFLTGAKLTRRDTLAVLSPDHKPAFSELRKRGVKRGIKNGLIVVEEPAFNLFWDEVLLPNLFSKHHTRPVHTAAEMEMLHKRFPKNIRHFNVYDNGMIVAGTTIFETTETAHSQYISAVEGKSTTGSLDFLYHHLITEVFRGKKYFDFGISNEQEGRKLNEGLSYWKESFGARTVVHDFYEVDTANFNLPEGFLV